MICGLIAVWGHLGLCPWHLIGAGQTWILWVDETLLPLSVSCSCTGADVQKCTVDNHSSIGLWVVVRTCSVWWLSGCCPGLYPAWPLLLTRTSQAVPHPYPQYQAVKGWYRYKNWQNLCLGVFPSVFPGSSNTTTFPLKPSSFFPSKLRSFRVDLHSPLELELRSLVTKNQFPFPLSWG